MCRNQGGVERRTDCAGRCRGEKDSRRSQIQINSLSASDSRDLSSSTTTLASLPSSSSHSQIPCPPTMDSYPLHYVALNRPLLLLSGLDSDPPANHHHDLLLDNGFQIDSDFPPLHGGLAEDLRNVFLQEDADLSTIRGAEAGLKIKTAGRVRRLPGVFYAPD